jgi:hypothetical protein
LIVVQLLLQIASPHRRLSWTSNAQDAYVHFVDSVEQAISFASLGLEKRFTDWFAETMAFECEAMLVSIPPQVVDCYRCSLIPCDSASG